jgi:hypothetical protein
MHTEEQARELWCPMVRADNAIGGSSNRGDRQTFDYPYPERIKCIASACAAWRWADPTTRYATPTARKGFCGLAGKPLM